jgi:hypothetical protein
MRALFNGLKSHILSRGHHRVAKLREYGPCAPATVCISTPTPETRQDVPEWDNAARSTALLYFLADYASFVVHGGDPEKVGPEDLKRVFPRRHPLYFLLPYTECARKSTATTTVDECIEKLVARKDGLEVTRSYSKETPWQRVLEEMVRALLAEYGGGVIGKARGWHVPVVELRRVFA